MNKNILTSKEQELFDIYHPLFKNQHFNLTVSNLGGCSSSNHWCIEDDIHPNISSHRFYNIYDSNKIADFELWLKFYLDFVTSYNILYSLNLYRNDKIFWDKNSLDYTKSQYTLTLLLEPSDIDFYEIECKLTFEVNKSSIFSELIATKLYDSDIQFKLSNGTPLTVTCNKGSNISCLLTQHNQTQKNNIKETILNTIDKLNTSIKKNINKTE